MTEGEYLKMKEVIKIAEEAYPDNSIDYVFEILYSGLKRVYRGESLEEI